jgi:hypothetical protein
MPMPETFGKLGSGKTAEEAKNFKNLRPERAANKIKKRR